MAVHGHPRNFGGPPSEVITAGHRYAEAHCNLGLVLVHQGKFRQALDYLRRGHELGSKRARWPNPSGRWIQNCERLLELDRRLPAVLRGEAAPGSAAERVEFARLCQRHKQFYAAATRLFDEAFRAKPSPPGALVAQNRYDAACAAALAGCGQGRDASRLGDRKRARWRKQALAWLRADLAAWAKYLGPPKPANLALPRQALRHWQQDPDLAGVRDKAALAKLPEAERQEWAKLWGEVAALLAKATPKK
jgi:serine/threonine-protein kinase